MTTKNLLIIDDEELLLTNLKLLFRKHADQIFIATNGREGLEILEEQDVHCIICDISMPGMNGLEVIREIRKKDELVPFIFYSAFGDHELMCEAAKFGAFDFITKPFFEDLEKVVTQGLLEGFHRRSGKPLRDSESEYSKILQEFLSLNNGER